MKQISKHTVTLAKLTLYREFQGEGAWGGEKERHPLVSWWWGGDLTAVSVSFYSQCWPFYKNTIRDIFEIMWYLFCAKQKRPKNWGKKRSGKTWKMKSGSGVDCKDDRNQGEMQYLEGGWAYTGFCCAIHPAGVSLQFIKSSKVTVWKVRRGGALTHLTTRVRPWTLEECQRSGGVKEDEIQPVNHREDLAAFGTLHTCQCVQSVVLQVAKRERGGVAVNWLLNSEQPSNKQWALTHTLRRGMPLEVGVAHSACLLLVGISVCAHHGRLVSSLNYSPAPRTSKFCKCG